VDFLLVLSELFR